MSIATYSFLPWLRQGVAARISETDTLGNANGTALERPNLSAELKLKFTGLDNSVSYATVSKNIQVVGPGDVVSLSQRAIVRTEPKSGVTNYEANGLPYIEFYEEDFLWRYTPAGPVNPSASVNATKLRPWLALVALKDDEYTLKSNPGGLPYITVKAEAFNNAFPSEKDTWAYAHVQINQRLASLQGEPLKQEVNTQVGANPDVAVSRLLCSRKLAKNTGYTAFLIPAFEAGRLIGLGIDITATPAQTPAWKKGAMPASNKRPYDFPVYFHWSFRTAEFGDFESLATMLTPIVMQAQSGKMPMDIQNPGYGLTPGANGTKTIGLESALKPPSFTPDPWPTNGSTNADDVATVNKFRQFLNLSADLVDKSQVVSSPNPFFNATLGNDPLLVPPVYGVWHAMVSKLGATGNPPWIENLNLDFRNRVAAGLGTAVVQKHQEDFVNRAWQQVNKVNEANKRIQEASLARMVNVSLFKKHIKNAGNDKAVMMTHPIQHLVKNAGGTKTVQQDFIDSRIPFAAKSAAFRRITRPNNKTEKVSAITPTPTRLIKFNNLMKQFNNINETDPAALTAAVLKRAPNTALSAGAVQTVVSNVLNQYNADAKNLAKDVVVQLIDQRVVLQGSMIDKAQLKSAVTAMNLPNVNVRTEAHILIDNFVGNIIQRDADGQTRVTVNDGKFKELFGEGIHAKSYNSNVILKDSVDIATVQVRSITTVQDVDQKAASYTTFKNKMTALPKAMAVPAMPNIQTISDQIFNKMNPMETMKKKLASTIKVWQGGSYVPLQDLKPVMAYPEFPEAVYTYLLELSKNYILPNIDKLPNNSITLLKNNQSFIEAFMAGMNHEMARELLWREYPTDRRGSYFRQFWNVDDNLFPENADPNLNRELKLDIKKMNEWTGALGTHSPRAKSANLVLVIRGDLLKKYPNTMIYAQMAEYDPSDPTKPRRLKGGITSAQTRFPLFKAEIDPDITLCGFDLDETQARGERILSGTSTTGKNPGWFFVMKERPGQVRFGLDDFTDAQGNTSGMPSGNAATWNDLTWEHLVNAKADLNTYHISFIKPVSITNSASQPVWGTNSADMAAILYQNPVLFARHAAEMLPG